ncbi:MAG: putative bifunctional diguanylate cyclase/phosphodiesterase [Granulosicoccus sp.]
MGFLTSIRRSLLFTSFTAIALILWLSGSFWYTAYVERLDASQLLESIENEDLLFETARILSSQRSFVHVLLSGRYAAQDDDLDKLKEDLVTTQIHFEKIRRNTSQSLTNDSLKDRFTFIDSEIREVFRDVVANYLDIVSKNEIILAQSSLKLADRDASFRDEIFLQYSALITSTQLLRWGTHFVPRHNALDIDHLQELRIANWQFEEAIAREASLISGVLASGLRLSQAQKKKIESLHIETLATWRTLQQYRSKRGSISELSNTITKIEETYFGDFVNLLNIILSEEDSRQTSPMTLDHWLSVEMQATQLLDQLDSLNSDEIRSVAIKVEERATRNLLIDSAIVLICLLIGAAVIGILRKVRHLATHDDLTGLPNRIYFDSLLDKQIESSQSQPVAVLFVDLDGFKEINDKLGHEIGDKLLKRVAKRMTKSIAKRGIVSRHGGDEFSVLVHEYAERDTVFYIAKMLIEAFDDEFNVAGFNIRIGASIGISFYPEDAQSALELKRNADFAMYFAKSQGRGCIYEYDDEIASEYKHRLQIKDDLKRAIEEKQFELVYQPQVGINAQAVEGLEALIRWQHPEKGFIPPDMFIPIAEESGQIQEIGDWVLDEACRQMANWHKSGLDSMQIAVNVSAMQFMRPNFIEYVEETCKKHELNPAFLELEITESVLVSDVQLVIETCQRLQKMQIKVAIDDFGTGYSSLSYLQELPVDTLKIDRAFVSGLDDITSKSVARTIVTLAQSCGLETVAEGVETNGQADMIAELGCDYIQGYYYSKPVSSGQLLEQVASINEYCQKHSSRHAA